MGILNEARLRAWHRAGHAIRGKSDGDGLTFTLSKAGTATWVFRYRLAGRQRELTLGNYPDMSLAAARTAARAARVRVDQGADVAAEKRATLLATARAGTFKQLADDYLERAGPALAATTRREIERYLLKDINPRIGRLPAADVTGSDVVDVIERIADRSDSVARHAFEILTVIFAHGVAKHFIKNNPCAGLKLTAILGQRPTRRERIKLTEGELQTLMAKLPTIGLKNALAAKILLATCVRKSELLLARRSHVDFGEGAWLIPDENSKTGKGFVVPLAPIVSDWFRALFVAGGASEWVVPGQRRDRHMSRSTLNVAFDRLDGLRRFAPHDLRSTARSYLTSQRIGVSIVVAERCLNHSLGGLVAVYDQHDYLEERRRALDLWANFLATAEAGLPNNVSVIRRVA